MASLIVANGKQEGLFLPLGKKSSVVGRDEAVPLQIEDERVSRKHMQVRFDATDGSYKAQDMKSANGVYINGRRVMDETALVDGDEITVGETKLLFVTADPTDKANAMTVLKKIGEKRRGTLMR